MIAAALLLFVTTAQRESAPSGKVCATAIHHGNPTKVPRKCWRIGPLTLGMTQAEVIRAIGPPSDTFADDTGMVFGRKVTYRDLVYVFPRDLAHRLAAHPVANIDFKLLELTFDGDRLARIGNSPGLKISGARCESGLQDAPSVAVDADAFTPFLTFADIRVGDTLARVRQVLGRWSSVNRGGDFYSYSPLPITLNANDGRKLNGFAIGADENIVFQGDGASIILDRDPATCRVRGFSFVPAGSG